MARAGGEADERNPDAPFVRGDVLPDLTVNVSDAIVLARFLFHGDLSFDPLNACADASDVNDDGQVDISDIVRVLRFLFLGEAPPPAPGFICGPDATPDNLDCNQLTCE